MSALSHLFIKPNAKLTITFDHTLILNTLLFNYRTATIDSFSIEALFGASKSLPERLQAHINQRQILQDKACSTQAWLLLKDCLQALGITRNDILDTVQFNAFGKPYFENSRFIDLNLAINFNFSHSDTKVICALSTMHNIGVDIEKIQAFDSGILNTYFTHPEVEFIAQASTPEDAFFSLWTKKEALLKCIGVGIAHINLASIEVLNNSITYQQRLFSFYAIEAGHGYVAHVCVESA